jgi:TPR repeat protein
MRARAAFRIFAIVTFLGFATGAHAAPTPLATLEARAATGEADALVELGTRYGYAEGVPRDWRRAAEFYCRAASKGHAGAAFQLGTMRLYGRGVARDDGSAVYWLARAAEAGNAPAVRMLRHLRVEPHPDDELCPPIRPTAKPGRPAVAPPKIAQAVNRLAPRFGLDPKLVTAVIAVESAFQVDAVSPKNAQGLMQLIPETATRFGVDRPLDTDQNLRGGMGYLRWLLQRFGGDVTLAAAAYNAGEGAVERYGGVPPYPETEDYVQKIRRYYGERRHPIGR